MKRKGMWIWMLALLLCLPALAEEAVIPGGEGLALECENVFIEDGAADALEVPEGLDLELDLGPDVSLALPGGEGVGMAEVPANEASTNDDRKYTVDEYGCLTSYWGSEANVVIDSDVTSIGKDAFAYNQYIEHVTLPDGLTSIGDRAFCYTHNLKSVHFPDSVRYIGVRAFEGSAITSAQLGSRMETIGQWAFRGCHLNSVFIPGTVRNLGDWIFEEAEVKSITLGEGLSYISNGMFLRCSMITLSLPGSVTSISPASFYRSTIQKITIPNSVKVIGESAFEECQSLQSVTIPGSVETIETRAFRQSGLQKLTLEKGVKSIGAYAFHKCGLKVLSIPDSVIDIGEGAFAGCESLKELKLGKGLTTISQLAFNYCTSLEKLTIPDNVVNMEAIAFCYCTSLKTLKLGKGLKVIPREAFSDCISLKSFTIPDNIVSIGERAFKNCKSLEKLTIPDTVVSLGDNAFQDCIALKTLKLGKGIKKIPHEAFTNCEKLKKVTIPVNVTSIGDGAFKECDALKTVTFKVDKQQNGVMLIGDCAFWRCGQLKKLKLPKSLTSIGDCAFWGCVKLTDVTIPNGVKTMGEEVFGSCYDLETAYYPKSITKIGKGQFSGCSKFKALYVDKNSTAMYWAKKYGVNYIIVDDALPPATYAEAAKKTQKLTNRLLGELEKHPKNIRAALKDDIFNEAYTPHPLSANGKKLPASAWKKIKEKYTACIDELGKDGSSYADLMKAKTPADLVNTMSKNYVFKKSSFTFDDTVKGVKYKYTVTMETVKQGKVSNTVLTIKDNKGNTYMGYLAKIKSRDIADDMKALKAFGQLKIEEAKQAVKDDSISLIKGAVLYDELKALAKSKAMVYIEVKNPNLAQAVREAKTMASMWQKLTTAFGQAKDWDGVLPEQIPSKYKKAQENWEAAFREAEDWLSKSVTQ